MPAPAPDTFRDAGSLVMALLLPFTGVMVKRLWTHTDTIQPLWAGRAGSAQGSTPLHWKPQQKIRSIWLLVYPLMGYASWRIYNSHEPCAAPLILYAALLLATWLCWPPLVSYKRPAAGLLDCLVLASVMGATFGWFAAMDKLAAALLLPYLGWTVFATVLVSTLDGEVHPQALQQAQRLAALKQQTPEQQTPAQQQQQNDHSVRSRQPTRTGHAHFNADGTLTMQDSQSLDQDAAKGTTMYRNDMALPDPVPTTSPRDPPDESQTSKQQQKPVIDRTSVGSSRRSSFGAELPSAFADASRRPESGEPAEAAQTAEGSWLNPITPMRSVMGMLREGSISRQNLSKSTSGQMSRQGSDPVRSSVDAVKGLLSRVSTSLSQTLASTTSSVLLRAGSRRSASADEEVVQPAAPQKLRDACSDTIDMTYFGQPGSAGFKVRGENYLADKKKYIPDEPAMTLASANLITQSKPTFHIARFLPSIRDSPAPFTFLWQVMVPGKQNYSLTIAWQLPYDPVAAVNRSLKSIPENEGGHPGSEDEEEADMFSDPAWQKLQQEQQAEASVSSPRGPSTTGASTPSTTAGEVPEQGNAPPARGHGHKRSRSRLEEVASDDRTLFGNPVGPPPKPKAAERTPYSHCRPFDVSVMRMLDETGEPGAKEKRRSAAFKVVPRVQEGNWMVKQAVGSTPALLGHKLVTKYFRGPRYLEVDLDVGSSRSAAHVVGLVSGALKNLVIDLAVVLEGRTQDELPESLLGTVRLMHLDLTQAAHLDNATGEISSKS